MIVIAKKGTTKLVKGCRYEVRSLYNSPNPTNRWNRGKVYLKDIGGYVVGNFTTTDGQPLPAIDWQATVVQEKRIEFEDLKVNDILVCRSDRYTTLIQGAKYRIVDLKIVSSPRPNSTYVRTTKKVKLEGCNRYFEYSSWKFRRLNTDEARELQLSAVLDNEEQSYSVDMENRKIDLIDNKNVALIKALAKSIMDGYRHELDVVDWACQKSASRLKVTRDDYKQLLKMPLKDILKLVETNK
jgi:hypothetical protein